MHREPGSENAIVLAMFGTSVEHALPGLLNVRAQMAARFPGTPVSMAFTSDTVRRIWRRRANDPAYVRSHPEIPAAILSIRGPRAAIADLRDAGYRAIVVQAVHMAPAREYEDLCGCVAGLNSGQAVRSGSRPSAALVVGRPALGSFGTRYPSAGDLKIAAAALADDVELAKRNKAALVYLGHGNRLPAAQNMYPEFAAEMQRQYPEVPISITTLEDMSTVDEAIAGLRRHGAGTVLLKPFLIAAGGHVMKDMMGGHPQSLKSRLEQAGFEVRPVLRGLGEQDPFAQIFVRHAADAAQDAGIGLR